MLSFHSTLPRVVFMNMVLVRPDDGNAYANGFSLFDECELIMMPTTCRLLVPRDTMLISSLLVRLRDRRCGGLHESSPTFSILCGRATAATLRPVQPLMSSIHSLGGLPRFFFASTIPWIIPSSKLSCIIT